MKKTMYTVTMPTQLQIQKHKHCGAHRAYLELHTFQFTCTLRASGNYYCYRYNYYYKKRMH